MPPVLMWRGLSERRVGVLVAICTLTSVLVMTTGRQQLTSLLQFIAISSAFV
jgi:hypothetical protein